MKKIQFTFIKVRRTNLLGLNAELRNSQLDNPLLN